MKVRDEAVSFDALRLKLAQALALKRQAQHALERAAQAAASAIAGYHEAANQLEDFLELHFSSSE